MRRVDRAVDLRKLALQVRLRYEQCEECSEDDETTEDEQDRTPESFRLADPAGIDDDEHEEPEHDQDRGQVSHGSAAITSSERGDVRTTPIA